MAWNCCGRPARPGRAMRPGCFRSSAASPTTNCGIAAGAYQLTQHGFARDLRFQWLERTAQSCTLRLTDSAATRPRYPFGFRLDITYAIDADRLDMTVGIANTGEETLPASFGAHPAFNWPLLPESAEGELQPDLPEPEPAAIRRLSGGLLRAEAEPSPVQGSVLPLDERLFEADAVILDAPASRSVRYAGPSGPSLEHRLGRAFANSASGRSRAARRSCASSRGAALPARSRLRRRVCRQARPDADCAGSDGDAADADHGGRAGPVAMGGAKRYPSIPDSRRRWVSRRTYPSRRATTGFSEDRRDVLVSDNRSSRTSRIKSTIIPLPLRRDGRSQLR